MKLPINLAPILLIGACAPMAVLVEETATTANKTEETAALPDVPTPRQDDGLLMPRGLMNIPRDQDMKPTVDPGGNAPSTLIATPPGEDEGASGE